MQTQAALTPAQAAALSLGRYWGSADSAALTTYPEGDASIRFTWSDGAAFTHYEPTHEAARATLARLGFSHTKA
jgi:hypothetical protein